MNCIGICASIALWLDHNGYAPYQQDAILKSLWMESRFETCVVSRSGSFLAQWAGTRLRWIETHYRGCPPWQWQMERLDWELKNVEVFACFWKSRTYATAFSAFRRGFEHGNCYAER